MAHAYHDQRARYFEHQYQVTRDHVIPFVELSGPLPSDAHVLEIGCAEAGVLKAFLERGARAVGVDLNRTRLERGREYLAEAVAGGHLTLLNQDAKTLLDDARFRTGFDLIVLKDVIEHIEDRPELLRVMARLLRPGGRVFLGFPPWQMPFGGHQQICKSWLLSRLPYFHLLPAPVYEKVLSAFREQPKRIQSLLATKRTGIASAELESLVERAGYRICNRRFYLLNPMYAYRFGVEPRLQADWVAARPQRDFVTTCAYYTLALDSIQPTPLKL